MGAEATARGSGGGGGGGSDSRGWEARQHQNPQKKRGRTEGTAILRFRDMVWAMQPPGRKPLGLQPSRYSGDTQAQVWNPHGHPVAEEVCCCQPHFTDGEIEARWLLKVSRLRRTEPGRRISTTQATGEEGLEKKEGLCTSKRQPLGPATGAPGPGSVTGWVEVGGYMEAMLFKNNMI